MQPAKVYLLITLFLASCAPPGASAPTRASAPVSQASDPTSTSGPSTPTLTPGAPTLTPTPMPAAGSTWTSPIDKMVMVYVPTGAFLMGSTDEDPLATIEEKPQHSVTLDAYWIDQTEVTNGMYELCVDRHVCREPTIGESLTYDWYWGNPQYWTYPVLYVNWNMAQAYCEWAGRRLPTEAEWEKAARGTDARIYPWGNGPLDHELANYDSYFGDVLNAGRYPKGASPYGAMEMAGNVMEWTADWFSESYYQNSPASNPMGPESGDKRVVRGGDFIHDETHTSEFLLRSAQRWGWEPALPASPDDKFGRASAGLNLGFRCARGTAL